MSSEVRRAIIDAVAAWELALDIRQQAQDVVAGLEKKLELARSTCAAAEFNCKRCRDDLQVLLHPPSGKTMGDIYREQGVPGYAEWKR